MVRKRLLAKLIVICGRQYAGKTTFAATWGGATGFPVFELGAFVFAAADVAGGQAPHLFAAREFSAGRFDRFVSDALAAIPEETAAAIVVGPRTCREINLLRESAAQTLCVGLLADYSERKQRWRLTSPRKPHVATEALWVERENFEDQWGIADAIADCELQISGVSYAPAK